MKHKRIVLVDDHKMFLEGLVTMFSKHDDIEVIKATSSIKEAFETIEKEKPDLVISDISMPEMSGIEFIAKLREKYPRIRIIVLSMFGSLQSYNGINGYLMKENSSEELVTAIREVVDHGRKYFKIPESKENNIILYDTVFFTKREKEVAKMIIKELTTAEIANKLNLAIPTIQTYRKVIFSKLDVKNIAGLTKKAIQLGLI